MPSQSAKPRQARQSFTCLARSSGCLVNTHKNLGTIAGSAGFINLAAGTNADTI